MSREPKLAEFRMNAKIGRATTTSRAKSMANDRNETDGGLRPAVFHAEEEGERGRRMQETY